MAASDNLQPALFHGTTHWFQPGDVVNPTPHPGGGSAAWGTTDMETAATYAKLKNAKQDQPALFSPIYEVETTSDELVDTYQPKVLKVTPKPSVGDRYGMKVKGLAGFVSYDGTLM